MSESMHLYIHLDDLEEDSSVAGSGKSDSKKNYWDKTADSAKSAARKVVSYATLKSTADQLISGSINQVSLSTGAEEYEQRLSAKYSIGQRVWQTGEMIAIGAMTGGLPGAIAGLALSGLSFGINYSIGVSRLQKEESLEDISIGMKNIRAGTAGRRSRDQ